MATPCDGQSLTALAACLECIPPGMQWAAALGQFCQIEGVVACDPATIVQNAVCIECGIPVGMQLPVLIALAAKQAGVSADPATLVANAACLECIPNGRQLEVLIYLFCQIANK
jgi:hypothetical protein